MPEDTVFDAAHAQRLAADVYATTKGRVRIEVLWRDLLAEVPALSGPPLRVIDVGAGLAQIAVRIARLGHEVIACDPSGEMLVRARDSAGGAPITFLRASAHEARRAVRSEFDLVLCHAVLEWVADPEAVLRDVSVLVVPGGTLSVLFYNANAATLKTVLRGDFAAARAGSGDTRPYPLDPAAVERWLGACGMECVSRAGIRIFHDHLDPPIAEQRFEELIELEAAFRKREPFASLAQHMHLVCRRPGASTPDVFR